MKLQHLKYFVAVFEEGSFSAGAQRVNATQSGLSMHVRQLEDRYQVQLLNRSSTGVTPTEAGKRFYRDAVRVLHAASEADANLRALSGAVTGHGPERPSTLHGQHAGSRGDPHAEQRPGAFEKRIF